MRRLHAAQAPESARWRGCRDDGNWHHHRGALESDLRLHGCSGPAQARGRLESGLHRQVREKPQALHVSERESVVLARLELPGARPISPVESGAARAAAAVGSLDRGAPRTGTPVVEVLSVEKFFPDGTRALAPIDLTDPAGEFVQLVGPSGGGKSTLLKLIADLLEPSDGRFLWWRGYGDKLGSDGRRIAFVFQDPTLMPWARAEANVGLALDFGGGTRQEA